MKNIAIKKEKYSEKSLFNLLNDNLLQEYNKFIKNFIKNYFNIKPLEKI